MSVAAHDIIQQALEECHHGRIHPESVAAAALAPPVPIPVLTVPVSLELPVEPCVSEFRSPLCLSFLDFL